MHFRNFFTKKHQQKIMGPLNSNGKYNQNKLLPAERPENRYKERNTTPFIAEYTTTRGIQFFLKTATEVENSNCMQSTLKSRQKKLWLPSH